MTFEIVRVGRELGTNLLELKGSPTLRYSYEGETKTVQGVDIVGLPEKATDISLNGMPVIITRQSDRTILQFGGQIETHVIRDLMTQWPSTLAHLKQLQDAENPHVKADRRSGKTTALCMRALEFRMEDHSVNIIVAGPSQGQDLRRTLEIVARELYPSGIDRLLAGVTVSQTVRECFDRYLVDEIALVRDHVLSYAREIHGSVTS